MNTVHVGQSLQIGVSLPDVGAPAKRISGRLRTSRSYLLA
jgi:hypothetical protein